MADLCVVPVALADRAYDVLVGDGARHELAAVVAQRTPKARRAVIVTQEHIGVEVDSGIDQSTVMVPDGEGAKSLSTVELLCRTFAQVGLSRSDLVVAVGGGVVTDLAGFAASAYHRGIDYINVSTSLLGQVDAAIGGKTGVNLPEGKNLVGAFWQPRAVICDTEVLATLPARERQSGRGEMAKYAFLGSAVGIDSANLLDLDLSDQVARCAAIKAAVVAADEREGDLRMILNYGHTLAHALEATVFGAEGDEALRHGEAVAIGLVFAALLAERLGRIDSARVVDHQRLVSGMDLSWALPVGRDPEELVSYMARDKKAHHDLSFVLEGPEGIELVADVDKSTVMETLAAFAALSEDAAADVRQP